MPRKIPFAGVSCEEDPTLGCKVWWVATIENRTHTVEAKIPHNDVVKVTTRYALAKYPRHTTRYKKELALEDLLKDSEAWID